MKQKFIVNEAGLKKHSKHDRLKNAKDRTVADFAIKGDGKVIYFPKKRY